MFVNEDSARETGTSRSSMNRIGKTRAAQGVKAYFNEYKDFHQCEVQAHICAAFMEMVDMRDVNGNLDSLLQFYISVFCCVHVCNIFL